MIKRIWLPGLCAVLIAGGVYWFFSSSTASTNLAAVVGANGVATGVAGTVANGVAGNAMEGPQAPGQNQNVNPPDNNQNNDQKNMQKIMGAIIHTNMGDITMAFNPATPNTVANFVKLAKAGFYDGTKFHRVIKGFMNQGGDPLSKDDSQVAKWGTGGPGYQFADEIGKDNKNVAGSVAMANSGPNTNGSQFFINVADNSFLNTKHTVFAMITSDDSAKVVMKINVVKTDPANDRPLEPVIIKSITLQ